jgi:hypothetical protein
LAGFRDEEVSSSIVSIYRHQQRMSRFRPDESILGKYIAMHLRHSYSALQNRLPRKYATRFTTQPHHDKAEQALYQGEAQNIIGRDQPDGYFAVDPNIISKSRAVWPLARRAPNR